MYSNPTVSKLVHSYLGEPSRTDLKKVALKDDELLEIMLDFGHQPVPLAELDIFINNLLSRGEFDLADKLEQVANRDTKENQ